MKSKIKGRVVRLKVVGAEIKGGYSEEHKRWEVVCIDKGQYRYGYGKEFFDAIKDALEG